MIFSENRYPPFRKKANVIAFMMMVSSLFVSPARIFLIALRPKQNDIEFPAAQEGPAVNLMNTGSGIVPDCIGLLLKVFVAPTKREQGGDDQHQGGVDGM